MSTGDRKNGVPTTVTSIPLVDPHAPVPDPSIGDLVKDATTQVSTLVRAEVELAKAEITRDVKKGLTGSVYFILALVVLFYSTFFFFFFVAELLDTWLWRWAAFLIVFGSLVAFTAYAWLLKNASTSLLSTYAYVNPAVAVFLGWALVGEHVGPKEIAAGLVILSSVALLVFGRAARVAAEPTAESLTPYIRRQDARVVEFPRNAPRLSDLRRISA